MIDYQILQILGLIVLAIAAIIVGSKTAVATSSIENRNIEVLAFGAIFVATVLVFIGCAFAIFTLIN